MGRWKLIAVLASILALVLSACGGDADTGDAATGGTKGDTKTEAASLDCRTIEVIVPYAPGGGSDQQVRRLQRALEKELDTKLTINYRTGGDGSVGWNALANAKPDGCTIANVVAPNIMNLSLTAGEQVGFKAEDFEYIAWTEFAPNFIGVAKDSKWKTIEEFVADAKANPGKLTMSGVGVNGELLASEVLKATGIEVSYVPVSGGVGEIIPQLAGGHIDAAISSSSLLEGGQVRPLALSQKSDKFPNVPTFEEAGYPGVELVTSWGFILPPETPQEIVETWNKAVQNALKDPAVVKAYDEAEFTVLEQDTEEARQYFEEQMEATKAAVEAMEETKK